MTTSTSTLGVRLLAMAGALLAAGSVALAAYAAHGVDGQTQSRLYTAAVFAFGHGVALAALAPRAHPRLMRIALVALLVGAVLFSGGVAASALAGVGGVAPFGGSLLILGWLLYAGASLRG